MAKKKTPSSTVVWIPASDRVVGLYARGGADGVIATTQPDEALRFDSEQDCAQWCRRHPVPPWTPVEHGLPGGES